LGLIEPTAQELSRGRRVWRSYGDNKAIIKTDWDELYDILFVPDVFPVMSRPDLAASHKKQFYLALENMKKRLIRQYEGVSSLPAYLSPDAIAQINIQRQNRLKMIMNWNISKIRNRFLNWNKDNPLEGK